MLSASMFFLAENSIPIVFSWYIMSKYIPSFSSSLYPSKAKMLLTGPVPRFFGWSGWITAIKVRSTPLKKGCQVWCYEMHILIVCKACQTRGSEGMPPRKFWNFRPCKIEFESIFDSQKSQTAMLKYRFLSWWGSSSSSGKITSKYIYV